MRKNNSIMPKLKFILDKGENFRTEFKEKVDSGLGKEMTAFANSSGGRIYIGITDDNKVKGVEVTNQLKSRIEDIANTCDPKISIALKSLKKEKILIIEVPESKDKPHRCSSGFYIRSGASSQKLTRNEVRGLMEEEGILRFDSLPCKKFVYKKHFDKEKLFLFLDKAKIHYNRKDYVQFLENLEVAERRKSKIIFNNTGALFFSKNLKKIFLQTEIICGLFKGRDKSHVLNNAYLNADLLGNIERAMEFLWKSLRARHEMVHKSAQRINVLEIPEKALREALINAVTHTNYLHEGVSITVEVYDDRVEISNFGGLPKGLTREEFGKKSVRRNPLIADLMARVGYIEKMGTGIKKMRELVRKEGLSPIKFEFTDFTTVTFYRKLFPGGDSVRTPKTIEMKNLSEKLSSALSIKNNTANEFLQILRHIEKDNFHKKSFVKSYNITMRTLNRRLTVLKNHNFIVFDGPKKTGKYKVTEKYKQFKVAQ